MRRASKLTSWLLGLLVLTAGLVWSGWQQIGQADKIPTDDNFHLYILDVGQGASIYGRAPGGFDFLVDGGEADAGAVGKLKKLRPKNDRLDLLVASHNHSDHIGGLTAVLQQIPVEEIWLSGAVHTTSTYLTMLRTIQNKKVPAETVTAGKTKTSGAVKLTVIHPLKNFTGQQPTDQHEANVVIRVDWQQFSALITGDFESQYQDTVAVTKSNVLIVPHHGSTDSLSPEFLQRVAPQIAVIPVGANNQFSHPSTKTVNLLQSLNIQIFRTDKNSTVEIISDGQKEWTKKEK